MKNVWDDNSLLRPRGDQSSPTPFVELNAAGHITGEFISTAYTREARIINSPTGRKFARQCDLIL